MQILQSKIKSIESEIEELRLRTVGIENEISSLEEQIMEVGGVKLRIQKSKVDGIIQQIELRNERIANSRMTKIKTEKEVMKQNKAVESSTRELDNVEAEVQTVDRELAQVQEQAREIEATSNNSGFEVEEKQEELATLKEELDAYKKEINLLRAAEIETRNKLEGHQKNLRDNKSKLRHWTEKLSELSLSDLG